MKTNKTTRFLAAAFALLALSAEAQAKDVYVYPTGEYTPVLHVKDIQRISFGDEGIEVLDVQGETSSVSYQDFDYFRFYPTPNPTGIRAPRQQQSAAVYSLTGVYQGEGESAVSHLPAGIYLIRQRENGQESVKKIMKK